MEETLKVMHATLPATGMQGGWSTVEDIGSSYNHSYNFFRNKFIGPNGIPVSACMHQQPLTNNENDLKTFKTAEGIVASHKDFLAKMDVSKDDIDQHWMHLGGDGQIADWKIAEKVRDDNGLVALFDSQTDTAHKIEIINKRV